MKRWLSRRHPRYVRSVVYMLQACEYAPRDFWRWHERVADFRAVEKRKRLVLTLKSVLLLGAGYAAALAALAFAGALLVSLSQPWGALAALVVAAECPLFVLGGILGALALLRALQMPVEFLAVRRAARSLRGHAGIRIAVAGSFGKTSMREILKAVLSAKIKVAAPPGSHNTPLAIARFISSLRGDEEALIFELGEYYPGDVRALSRMVRPHWGIITGVNEAHLEKFGSLERTSDTIFELAEFVDAGRLYVNGENEEAAKRAARGALYTREGAGQCRARNVRTGLDGTSFRIEIEGRPLEAHSALLGAHMAGPLCAAADIARRLGFTGEEILRGIANTKPFEHRLEPKKLGDAVFLDDSYNGNPDGARAVIDFLSALPGRRFYATPGFVEAGEKTREVHEALGRQLAVSGIEYVALIETSAAPLIESGLAESGFAGETLRFPDMPSCLRGLQARALPGDIILVQNDWPDQYA